MQIYDKNNDTILDKLAQLTNHCKSDTCESGEKTGKKTLAKRAKSKYVSKNVSVKLADLGSDLRKSYFNTFYCCDNLIQTGKKITGKYCNNRWCLVCNRIRTAKLINGYKNVLQELPDKRFVTLSRPNVKASDLREEIQYLLLVITKIRKSLTYRKTPIVGIRKLECTYNPVTNTYHPHFHFIVSGQNISSLLLAEWLKENKTANISAQDDRPANDDSVMELFKYFTKIVTKDAIYIDALDVIFRSMYGLRTFQPMGISKNVSEDIEEIRAEIYADLEERETIWSWIETDWIDKSTGECLTGYSPDERTQKIVNNLLIKVSKSVSIDV